MNQRFIYSEQVDRYLKGKLSESEQLAFDEKMRQDPLLQSEVKMQQEVFQAIGEVRKASIKARLNQLPIDQSPWLVGSPFKLAAVVSALVIASWGTYVAVSPSDADGYSEIDITDAVADARTDKQLQAPKPKMVSEPTPLPDVVIAAPDENTLVADARSSAVETATRELPIVHRPAVTENFSEDEVQLDYSDFEIPQKQALQANMANEASISVESVPSEKYSFHYQFYDDKLFLHGSFDQEPYKIIALNTEKGRRLFLEYADNFYLLEEQRKVSPLVLVQDKELSTELRQLSITY